MRIVIYVCALMLIASACGRHANDAPDAAASSPCVLGSSNLGRLGHCTLGG